MTVIVAACAVLLVLWTAAQFRSSTRRIQVMIGIVALVLYLVVLHLAFGFPSFSNGLAKGPEPDLRPLVLVLFVCMVLGMAAEYLYHYLDAKPAQRKFDWGSLVKPFLVSPLVFVPLAASLQAANVDLSTFNIPLLMLYLVAFENGFLWRGYFARKLAESQSVVAK
jgi:H+/Cl- antiporter ClcA